MRLFAGIELDEATRAMCVDVANRLQHAAFEAKYEAAEKLHVTLAFLGNVREDQLAAVEDVLSDVAGATQEFDLAWDRVGAFPNERRPRIAYVGSREQGAAYRSLSQRLREAYRALSFDFKEDAVAHVTIARIKGGSARALPLLDLSPHVMHVRELVLFESLPGERTTRYEIRQRASVGPRLA
ncbi:MAG: RNA 2',3'-cyclic phosphodiesterase [Candidatus Eremiobacteraeota bacterium]|nr:RNA 2',3'-cyclic phosphodiesterase [Candidatus Eremiobacteraeota bacterium]